MAHPFFDALTYPWTRQDAQDLHTTLFNNVKAFGTIELLYQKCVTPATPLTPNQAAHLAWKEVLELVTSARRLGRLFELLLELAVAPTLRPAIEAVQNATNPLEDALLSTDVIFVDRKRLKLLLQKLEGPSATHGVLLVRGDRRSGKTWTERLVTDVAQSHGADSIFLFEGLVSTADEVLDALFAKMEGMDRKPALTTTEDAWFRLACTRLLELAEKKKRLLWVVVDDLGTTETGPRLDPTVRTFFDQFALAMANPAFAKWFRLVLIDYPDGPVPTRWKPFWVADKLTEAEVDKAAIAEFVVAWARRRKKTISQAAADDTAADIIAKVDAPGEAAGAGAGEESPPPSRLTRINEALAAVLEGL
jgi:hypothetical protein